MHCFRSRTSAVWRLLAYENFVIFEFERDHKMNGKLKIREIAAQTGLSI
ncbi:MAG: cytochrome-c peroxidase, partial [Enterobacterales bacterium]|nr:cytochrome-c peroxidase [Enterobacterales bacterium]